MIRGMAKSYRGQGKRVCRSMIDGSKVCASEKAWSVFFATIRKRKWDDTKPMPKSLSSELILNMIKNNIEKYEYKDLELFHALGHTLSNEAGDTGCKLHYFVVKEMKRRGLIHLSRMECDEIIEGTYEGEPIELEEVLSIFRDSGIIKIGKYPTIYLSGKLVEEGKINKVGSHIDVLLTNSPDINIVVAYKKILPGWLFDKLNFVWNSKEVDVESSVPIYTQSLVPSKKELIKKELREEKLELDKQYVILKPKDTFYNIKESWDRWGSDHIDNEIIVKEKLPGYSVQFHINKNGVFGSDFNELIKEELSNIDVKEGVFEGQIVKYKEGKFEGVNARGKRESGILSNEGVPILVLNDILYLNNEDLSNKSVKERIDILEECIPKDLKYVDTVKSRLINNYKDYFSSVILSKHGLIMKDATSIYPIKYAGDNKTSEWINLINDGRDPLMELEDFEVEFELCKFYGSEVCLGSRDCELSKYYSCRC